MKSIKYINCFKLLFAILCVWLCILNAVSAAKIDEIETALGLNHNHLKKLHRGEIVSFKITEETQKELALGLAMYLDAPPTKLVSFFKKGDLAMVDPDVVSFHEILPKSNSNPFEEFMFTPDQMDEARKLLEVTADDEFNLSAEEIKSFTALKNKLAKKRDTDLITAVSKHYQKILLNRLQGYQIRGLAGVESYARKEMSANPAEELRIAASSSKLLNSFSSDLQKLWLTYPTPLPTGTEEYYSWLNRNIDNRPTAIISHRLLFSSDTGSIILSRQFYVGHTYNSSQFILSCLPYRHGSIVFYTHQVSTDQVTGVGEKLKHSMGRKQMKKQMIINLNGLRSRIQSSSSEK